jgi:hypothetical protein
LSAFVLFLLPASALATEEWTIPSSRCRGLFIVQVSWNEVTMDLILDTGAESSSIDPDAVSRALGRSVKPGRDVTMRDATAGPFRFGRLKARVHEMDHLALALGHPIDGILGFDAFRSVLLTIDYPESRIEVTSGTLPAVDHSRTFPTIGKGRPFLTLDLGGLRVPLLIDSGFSGGIDLDRDDPLEWEIEPRPIHASVRYSEVVIQHAGRLAGRLKVGPATLERPVVRVSDGTRLLGSTVLEHFVLTFDARNRRVRMVPGSDAPIRFEPVRGIGLAIHPREGVAEVIAVFPGSPAEGVGIRVGDRITTINGVPIADRGCVSFVGETARSIGFDRDGESLEVDIEPAVLVP